MRPSREAKIKNIAFHRSKLLSTPARTLGQFLVSRLIFSGYGQLVTLCNNNKQYFNYRNWIMSQWGSEWRDVLELKIGTLWPHFTTCSFVSSQNKYQSDFLRELFSLCVLPASAYTQQKRGKKIRQEKGKQNRYFFPVSSEMRLEQQLIPV